MILRRFLRAGAALVLIVLLAVGVIYAWPLGLDEGTAYPVSFSEAQARIGRLVDADESDPEVTAECRSQALIHSGRTAKSVLMLHGYTGCPAQMSSLARRFYDQGYNVWVPRAPRQGVTDPKAHAGLTTDELLAYASDSFDLTAGLGDEAGVVGISGGAVLATWLARHRPAARLLTLSPFYAPSAKQAPAWQVKPMIVLYGNRLLPDRYAAGTGFSFFALSQYLRIARNLDGGRSTTLKSIGLVTSEADTYIDLRRATEVAESLGPITRFTLPASWGIGHNIVAPAVLGPRTASLEKTYFELYEGRTVSAVG
ncbi:alpha/beta hydrolase [Paractinoplanes brasiliensis]|uniref:alpha/beta hydrolase n=1 Tax=Paractinoplanes brasiliensis TaxID=52695 RepID=UPI00105E289C|nr:alpha/beta fold hydrolase [Actinoplanes brasiliensis]